MPSLKSIRRRITSVKSSQKITKAMKLVAAAKLRRGQDAIVAARPYAQALARAVSEIGSRAGTDEHPLLQRRPPERVVVIALTSDRGLCGAFNTTIGRRAQAELAERKSADVGLYVVGRKGREYFKRRKLPVKRELPGVTGESALLRAQELAEIVSREFADGLIDEVILVYNEFKSAVTQRVVAEPLLPVVAPEAAEGGAAMDFVYEPSKKELLDAVLPQYVESQLYRALLESIASEFGARMTAMDNASRNAKAMIERLSLQYNRARQASITKELMEIVGGAEALKG